MLAAPSDDHQPTSGPSALADGASMDGGLAGALLETSTGYCQLGPGACGPAGAGEGRVPEAPVCCGAIARIYIAGPMSNLPDLNYPAFNVAAKQLRALGYEVENPAENPAPACGSWEGYMRLAIAQLVRCDEIHLLRGWSQSRGAKIERELAGQLGLVVSGAPA